MIKEDCGKCFIYMQTADLTKTGKTGNRNILEKVDVIDFLRIAETAQDTVVEDAADWHRLVLGKRADLLGNGIGKRGALEQVQLFARNDITEEIDMVMAFINRSD